MVLVYAASGCVTTAGMQSTVVRAKDKVAPALVHIRPVKEVFAGGKREEVLALGSGFIISPDGYVVTNEHVAGEADLVRCVLYNQEEVDAEVVGVDPYTDIALLKLAVDEPLPYALLGTSSTLEAGQTVLALGSPHGLARSVSLGIVSVTDRYLDDTGDMVSPYNNWIQTDAAINRGNSGGPLVNLKGEVVGVNARMLAGAENVGFAIPIDIAREVIDALQREGRVRRSRLGVALQEMTRKTDAPDARGVIVGDVDQLGPAIEAGLRPGDVMLSVNGKPTNARFAEHLPAVRKMIADIPVGSEVAIRIARGDEERVITLVTDEKSALKAHELEFTEWGFTASELTPIMVRRAQLAERLGVAVSGTRPGGIAAKAGLQEGDIILEVDAETVQDLAHFRRLYRQRLDSGARLTMLWVKNGALTRFVLVKHAPDEALPAEQPAEQGGGLDEE